MTRKRDTSNMGHILKRECALSRTHAYFQTECPTLYLRPAFRSSGPSWTGESNPGRKQSGSGEVDISAHVGDGGEFWV